MPGRLVWFQESEEDGEENFGLSGQHVKVAVQDCGHNADEAHNNGKTGPLRALSRLAAHDTCVGRRGRAGHVELDWRREESNDQRAHTLF